MQKIILCVSLIVLTISACTNGAPAKSVQANQVDGDTLTESRGSAASIMADTSISGCYTAIFKRDTSNLQLDIKGTSVSGPLSFNIYEKDRNDGTFQGEYDNGMIKGWYLFKSEAVISVRETIFKVKDKKLIPAVGEMVQKNDSSFFTNPANLKFDESRALIKVKCIV